MQATSFSCRAGILLACLISALAATAQQSASVPKENGVYTLHEGTHLVLLDVTVADKQGQPVTGLTKDDFKLTEDGQPQTIKFFEEHAPGAPFMHSIIVHEWVCHRKLHAQTAQPPRPQD